jgi:hypothetical protein
MSVIIGIIIGITGIVGSADYTTLISSLFREPEGFIHLDSSRSWAFLEEKIISQLHRVLITVGLTRSCRRESISQYPLDES